MTVIKPMTDTTIARRAPRHRPTRDIPLACVLLSLAVGAYLLTLPHFLIGVRPSGPGFDEGAYFASVVSFVHGGLPYRSFPLVQPPGILILLGPVALLGRVIGTADAMAIARVLDLLFAAANAGLASFALRSRGRIGMAVAGVTMAAFPLGAMNFQTLRLEPPMVFFFLLGVVLAFDRAGDLASSRRLIFAGTSIGFSVDLKVWTAVAGIALLACCWRRWRQLRASAIGLIGAIVVVVGPFFLLSPSDFVRDVVTLQLRRKAAYPTPLLSRLSYIFGLASPTTGARHGHLAGALAAVSVIAVISCAVAAGHQLTRVEWFAIASALVTIGVLLKAREFFDYYSYATLAFLALVAGVAVSRYFQAIRRLAIGARGRRSTGWGPRAYLSGVAVIGLLGVAGAAVECYNTRLYIAGTIDNAAAIDALVPAGSCVLSDNPTILVEADRSPVESRRCPAVIDPQSVFLLTEHVPPPGTQPFPQALSDYWLTAFAHAQYVVEAFSYSDYLPWNDELYAAFGRQFVQIYSAPGTYVYARRG